MFKILVISIITFIIVIIIFLLFMSFMNSDIINNNSKKIEKFASEPVISNGQKISSTNSTYFKFTNTNGFCSIKFDENIKCDVLIVGGGGGGGRNDGWEGGGGGGGGNVGRGTLTFEKNITYIIKIGNGGKGGSSPQTNGYNGENTTIAGGLLNEIAYGGGGGGWQHGNEGGSGGGGSGHAGDFQGGPKKTGEKSQKGASDLVFTGNDGGKGDNAAGGGGGGGAGSYDPEIHSSRNNFNGKKGGDGVQSSIDDLFYGGGGGGASGCWGGCNPLNGVSAGKGGKGGGGNGGHRNNPTNGLENTGGGGGGSSYANGGNGGSGILLIKYKSMENFTNYDNNTEKKDISTNLFKSKKPWGIYLANNWSNNTLFDTSGNNRNATTTGNITQKSVNGYGVIGNINVISGGVNSQIIWPEGSIPANFTMLSFTRYSGNSRRRILSNDIDSHYQKGANFLHGHWEQRSGVCHYNSWKIYTNELSRNNWLCCIGKNGGTIPNNILIDGQATGKESGGSGNYTLAVNKNPWGEHSDWDLSFVIIWDQHLTDEEMRILNNMVNIYKIIGGDLSTLYKKDEVMLSLSDDSNPPTEDQQLTIDLSMYYYKSIYNSSFTINEKMVDGLLTSKREIKKMIDQNSDEIFNKIINNDDKQYVKKGNYIAIEFDKSYILKKYIFIVNDINNAPSSWTIYGLSKKDTDKFELIKLEDGSARREDYDKKTNKDDKTLIKFMMNNSFESIIYFIVFKDTINKDGILDISQIILDEGVEDESKSTGKKIEQNNSSALF
jgi:hypothetical protein